MPYEYLVAAVQIALNMSSQCLNRSRQLQCLPVNLEEDQPASPIVQFKTYYFSFNVSLSLSNSLKNINKWAQIIWGGEEGEHVIIAEF